MSMDGEQLPKWHRDANPFDVLAIVASLVVIIGGFLIVHSASREYTIASRYAPPVASTVPALNPTIVPVPGAAPTQ